MGLCVCESVGVCVGVTEHMRAHSQCDRVGVCEWVRVCECACVCMCECVGQCVLVCM